MHYTELIEILQKKYEIYPCTNGSSSKVKDIKLLDSTIKQWDGNTIYLGSFASLNSKPNKAIMLFNTDEKNSSCSLPKGSSYCHIDNEDLLNLFNDIKDLISQSLRTQADLFEISKAALDGKSIVSIINIAAKLVGNALILTDPGIKVLAYSTVYEIMDPLWADNIERGHDSYEFMQMVRSNEQMKEWGKWGGETQLITLTGDIQPKLVARTIKDGHLVGALVMIAHHTPINNYHHKQLPIIAEILFNSFYNSTVESGYKSFYSNILYNLLDQEDVADTFELMDMSKADFPSKMYVVVARFVRRIENRYLKRSIGIELEYIFPEGYLVQYKNYIGILVHSISVEQREKLIKLAQSEDINIGISWSFTDILQFRRYFYQAVISIKQAQYFNKTKYVFDYTSFSYYDLLWNYSGKTPLKHYCNPALEILRNYDKSNNTELYITLRTYLECNMNLSETARTLFIHRNSLVYRINRVNELTELDLDNIDVLHSLIDSFRIESFLNLTV